MTLDQLFDLVAPVAITHHADLRYEAKAQQALRILEQNENDPTVIESFKSPTAERNWLDYLDEHEPEGFPAIQDVYKELFDLIVEEEAPGFERFVDRWGAYAWRDANRTLVFAGDSQMQYPWYETAQLLRERIAQHAQEQEE